MLGYCAIGKVRTEIPPASMRTIAMTHAKTGRPMKKRDMSRLSGLAGRRGIAAGLGDAQGMTCQRRHLLGRDRRAGTDLLHALDDDLFAVPHALGNQPVVADRSIRSKDPQLHLTVRSDHQCRRLAALVV